MIIYKPKIGIGPAVLLLVTAWFLLVRADRQPGRSTAPAQT